MSLCALRQRNEMKSLSKLGRHKFNFLCFWNRQQVCEEKEHLLGCWGRPRTSLLSNESTTDWRLASIIQSHTCFTLKVYFVITSQEHFSSHLKVSLRFNQTFLRSKVKDEHSIPLLLSLCAQIPLYLPLPFMEPSYIHACTQIFFVSFQPVLRTCRHLLG